MRFIFSLTLSLFFFGVTGCSSILAIDQHTVEGELAPNLHLFEADEPLKDTWKKVHSTTTQEIWVDSANQIVVLKQGDNATLMFSDIENIQYVHLFNGKDRYFLSENTHDNQRLVVFRKEYDGKRWWYMDKDGDGILDIRFAEGVDGSGEELRSQNFRPYGLE